MKASRRRFEECFRTPRRDAEEHLGCSARCAAPLLPVVQCANTDAQQPGKPALRQAKLFPRGGNALVPCRFLRAPERFGVNRAVREASLSIRAHFPNIRRRGRAAHNFFLGLNQFLHAARIHNVTFRFSSPISAAPRLSCSPLAYMSKSKILSAEVHQKQMIRCASPLAMTFGGPANFAKSPRSRNDLARSGMDSEPFQQPEQFFILHQTFAPLLKAVVFDEDHLPRLYSIGA